MTFTSPRGRQIVFDDFEDDKEYGIYWVEMCRCCHNKFRKILGKRPDDGGTAQATCCVKGCENEAYYYVDFAKEEVKMR